MTLFGSVARLARLSSRRQLSTSAPRAGDHGWSYRTTPYPTSDFLAKASTGIMTFTWWWIFHGTHCLTLFLIYLFVMFNLLFYVQEFSQNPPIYSRSGTTILSLRSGLTPSSESRQMTSEE